MATKTFTSHLGIATDDVITTSWNTGPYTVWHVSDPTFVVNPAGCIVVLPYPVVYLTLILPGRLPVNGNGFYYINDVYHIDGNQYGSGGGTVTVERAQGSFVQMDMFSAPAPLQTCVFTPGVDYTVMDGELWHCRYCQKDYNGLTVPTVPTMVPGDPRGRRPLCPHCEAWPEKIFIVQPGEKLNSYLIAMSVRMIAQYREFAPERIAYLENK